MTYIPNKAAFEIIYRRSGIRLLPEELDIYKQDNSDHTRNTKARAVTACFWFS